MVQVFGAMGSCSGMVISGNTVLTAAHCFCEAGTVGGNVCHSGAEVRFRGNPNVGVLPSSLTGTINVHPDYNPTITGQIEHDIAMVHLRGIAPLYASPFIAADDYAAVDSTVMISGFGSTGTDCDLANESTLNFDLTTIHDYEDGHDFIVIEPQRFCPGDSGGAVLEDDGSSSPRRLLAVHSGWQSWFGSTYNLSTTTTAHFDWIKSGICHSNSMNSCNGQGERCNCSAAKTVLWRNTASGDAAIWFVNEGLVESEPVFSPIPTGWSIVGSGDFNGDRHADILWQESSGQIAIWHMNDGVRLFDLYPGGNNPPSWTVQGVADFDHNGRSDILWRENTGQLAIWLTLLRQMTDRPAAA